uniref:Uncharacterized protein n=1 Tax=Megaselia scalaris TaxID=36166 RepID=T1GFD8_MEGSC
MVDSVKVGILHSTPVQECLYHIGCPIAHGRSNAPFFVEREKLVQIFIISHNVVENSVHLPGIQHDQQD